ncbi:winged helix-turn-helix domain-containing protein [Gordonia sp. CPCC 205333]|uniref:winged helix-turn-helix domain-containing protein n=1 Tax=Gordonia sp. CPCC 205333 TaxID=3140790 RepID=UPI003AF3F7F4
MALRSRDLSTTQARRIALAAQGFTDPQPSKTPGRADLKRVLRRTKLVQMDSVNILARAHYVPTFSRIGAYDTGILQRAAWSSNSRPPRLLVEYWAHEAALIPVEDWPLFGWRMNHFREGRYRYTREVLRRNRSQVDDVLAIITERGASTPRQIEESLGIERQGATKGSWWDRGEIKHLCEAMFAGGTLSAVRNDHFVRHYDLASRVVGDVSEVAVDEREAHRQLVSRAASAHGIATVADLADYYRLKTADVRAVLGDLIEDGEICAVRVDGWTDEAYLHRTAKIPRTTERSALLSPFDPLVFFRPRTERLFDFHYRIEIYVPEHKRVHGYYVLPYLLGDTIVARVDLKADRKAGVLQVLSSHIETGQDRAEVAARLADDLTTMANWRGLDTVDVRSRGELAPALQAATRSGRPR